MTGFVIAMQSEAKILLENMQIEETKTVLGKTVYLGKAYGKKIMLTVCGVGKVNAGTGACALISLGATALYNFGVAGGLHAGMELTKVYLIDKAVQYDFDLTQLNGGQIGTLDEEKENYFPLYCPDLTLPKKALGSGDRFNDSPADNALLTDVLHADIRDMEGAAIAQVAKYADVPFSSVKAISDVYGSGSTTEQFKQNLQTAMANLQAYLPAIFEELL